MRSSTPRATKSIDNNYTVKCSKVEAKRQGRTLVQHLKESVFVKFHILPKWSVGAWGRKTTTSHFAIPNQMIRQ
jgi:hypothetical protein